MQETVAFQGIHGANSELAVRQHFGEDVSTYPCNDLTSLFEVIRTNIVQYALVPVENSVAGAVSGAYELLMDHDLRIQGEVILQVHHMLVAPHSISSAEELEEVRSHPQALAQCERYLKRYKLKPVPWYDTAGAAKELDQNSQAKVGAIATSLAAELYNLNILAEQIEDYPFNYTRFLILGHDDPQRSEYNKTSLVFATRNTPAALYECLGEFAQRGLNLTKLESRPRRNRPWEPVFYLDFEGHWQEPACQEALTRLLQKASFVKMLGSYPAVKTDSVGI